MPDFQHDIEAQTLLELLFSTQALAPLATKDSQPSVPIDGRTAQADMKSHTLPVSSGQAGPPYSHLSSSSSSSCNSRPSPTSPEQTRCEAARNFVALTFARERETGSTAWPTPDEFEAQRLLEEQEDEEISYDDVQSHFISLEREREPRWVPFARLWEWGWEILRHFRRRLGNQARMGGRWLFVTGMVLARRMVDFDFDDNVECVLWCYIGGLAVLAMGFVGVVIWAMSKTWN
ncbi:hypothetical protein BCR34DRAFT_589523 [Clohesyomyces aquaticus]|uniref:Uncharacterized protein n=1 Tax=Clohesyomyces aquaticus TaxID=1231657 RepID=A0A1Y1ZFX9_9PLEO|nr:hypothetical protein BCR34DRAFT_589523 [Clohesyomyces aquaticus]